MSAAYKIVQIPGPAVAVPRPEPTYGIVAVCPSCQLEYDADDFDLAPAGVNGWMFDEGFYKVASRRCGCGGEVRRTIGASAYTIGLRTSCVARLAAQAKARMLTDEAEAEFNPARWDVAADSADEAEAMWRALVTKCDGDEDRARRLLAMVDL